MYLYVRGENVSVGVGCTCMCVEVGECKCMHVLEMCEYVHVLCVGR